MIELPEIGVSSALHCSLHRPGSGVIGRHRQIPVAKLVIEILQMARGGACGFLRILPVIDPNIVREAVAASTAGHKLPDATGADAGNGQRMEP
jgi:hypothetical protein